MEQYIDKVAVVAEIDRRIQFFTEESGNSNSDIVIALFGLKSFIDTIKVIDPYIMCIQYTDRESAIKSHAEDYSWNIESELFQQLTPEQQKLWRKEIEQACISGGYSGLNLAKDPRYKENLKVKEVDLEKELDKEWNKCEPIDEGIGLEIASIEHEQFDNISKHFFKLGLKAQKGE